LYPSSSSHPPAPDIPPLSLHDSLPIWRLRHGRHFDKIVSHLLCFLERINRRHDAELLALRTDDAYWRDSDLSIDSQFWNCDRARSEEHTLNSSHEWISYAVFCLKKKT